MDMVDRKKVRLTKPSTSHAARLRHVVMTWLTTGRGGAERSVPELASGLAACGLKVTLLWWQLDGDAFRSLLAEGVVLCQVTSADQYVTALTDILTVVPARGAVVISNHRTAAIDLEVCRPRNVPVVPVLRGMLVAGHALRTVDPVSRQVVAHLPERLPWSRLADAACWVGVSVASAESVAPYLGGDTPVRAIYNGIRVQPPAVPALAAAQGVGRPLRCVAVARPAGWKRVETLVRAFAVLPPGLAHLDVYGQDADLAPWSSAIGPAAPVRLHGWVADLHERIRGADLLITASLMEGFGRAIAEAAGLGIPSVVPVGGANTELVLDGLTGWVYDAADPTSLPHLLCGVAALDPAERAAAGRRAQARAAGLFTPERCAAEYLDVCHAVTGACRRATAQPQIVEVPACG